MEIWTIRGVDLSTLQDQLLGGCVVVPFNLPDLRGGVCTAGDGLQSLPTSSACQVVLWEHHCYCLNVFLLCLLTIVQLDMETLLRLSSSRRWYWNHWLIHQYKCTFSELLSYLLCCLPIRAKNYIHIAFHIFVTRYKNYGLQKAVLNELVSLSWLDNKCFNVSSSKCYKVVFVYLGPQWV